MDVEILTIEDCPNRAGAESRVDAALAAAGAADVAVRVRVVRTVAEAAATGFHGSPTILVDGTDPFPHANGVGLACRVYPTADGFAPVPPLDDLVAVFAQRKER